MSQVQTNAITIRSIFSIIKEAIRGEQQDYTAGSMRKAIVLLAIPMILELASGKRFRHCRHVCGRKARSGCNSNGRSD